MSAVETRRNKGPSMKNVMRNLLNRWNRLGNSTQPAVMLEDSINPARNMNMGEGKMGAAEDFRFITALPSVQKSAKIASGQENIGRVIALSSLQRLLNDKLVVMDKNEKKQRKKKSDLSVRNIDARPDMSDSDRVLFSFSYREENAPSKMQKVGKDIPPLYISDSMRHGALMELMKSFTERDKKTNIAKGIKNPRTKESSSHFVAAGYDKNTDNEIKERSEDNTGKGTVPVGKRDAAPSETLRKTHQPGSSGLMKMWETDLLDRVRKSEDVRSVSLKNNEDAPIDSSRQQNNAKDVEHDEILYPVEKNYASLSNMPLNVGDDPAADTNAHKTITEWKKTQMIRIIEDLLGGRDLTKDDLLYLQHEPEMFDLIGRILAQNAAPDKPHLSLSE